MLASVIAIPLDEGVTLQINDHRYIRDQRIRNPKSALTGLKTWKFCSIATNLTAIGCDHRWEKSDPVLRP